MGKIALIKNKDSNGIYYDIYDEDDKKGTINIPNDIPFVNFNNNENNENNENNKHLKGYIFDSLVYRYQLSRRVQAKYEYEVDKHNKKACEERADRDIMRFIEILNEAIGEHD